MLLDLFTSLATSCSPHLRALGYLNEARDMRRRVRRNHAAWRPHLNNTRRFVLSAAERCRNRDKVVVLGSGLLLDVPLAELAGSFREVVLKDVVSFPESRKQLKRFPNVRFYEHDVTGLAERMRCHLRAGCKHLPEIVPDRPGRDDDAGLVVSLNILSQLWVVPRAFIGQTFRHLEPEQVDDWCARIVEDHYLRLRSLPCNICLVADFESVRRDRAGTIVTRTSTIYGMALPKPDETWTWSIAPLGKENPHISKELIVGAWHLQNRAEADRLP